MKDIEKVIQKIFLEDEKIPEEVNNKIQYALNNLDSYGENKGIKSIIQTLKSNSIKRLATAVATVIIALIGSVTVYAAFGGTIDGKPVFEWIKAGIMFSDEYGEYKQAINEQKLQHNGATVNLTYAIYDENYVLLEFDVKLSKEDKEYLRLGEYMIEDEFIQLKENENQKEILIKEKEKGIINTLYIEFGTNTPNVSGSGGKSNISIDGKGYWTGRLQTKTKISDYEYKLYQMYFLTDEMTNKKEEITITFNHITMQNQGDTGKEGGIANIAGNYRTFDLDGEINIKVSKNKISEDTKIITPTYEEIKYKNMTQKIEQIRITPLQTIIKLSIEIDNVNSENVTNFLNTEAKVYDNNNNELMAYTQELEKTIIYNDEEIEEWELEDIDNATINISEIIIIEEGENINELRITPTIEERIWSEQEGFKNQRVDLDSFYINLNK